MKKGNTKQWFIERIGKRIFRDRVSCPCSVCDRIYQEGLIVRDEYHAEYIWEISSEYESNGISLNYRDKK